MCLRNYQNKRLLFSYTVVFLPWERWGACSRFPLEAGARSEVRSSTKCCTLLASITSSRGPIETTTSWWWHRIWTKVNSETNYIFQLQNYKKCFVWLMSTSTWFKLLYVTFFFVYKGKRLQEKKYLWLFVFVKSCRS